METKRPTETVDDVRGRSRNPGKISDYSAPVEEPEFASPYAQRNAATVVYDSSRGGEGHRIHHQRTQPGSIADYDPLNDQHSSVVRNPYAQQPEAPRGYQATQFQATTPYHTWSPHQPQAAPPQAQPVHQPVHQPVPQPQPVRVSQPPPPRQPCFQAIYDYTAADTDEVSFVEGDIIINSEKVDEGWMLGTVQRTGQHGMLPSNYVEQV